MIMRFARVMTHRDKGSIVYWKSLAVGGPLIASFFTWFWYDYRNSDIDRWRRRYGESGNGVVAFANSEWRGWIFMVLAFAGLAATASAATWYFKFERTGRGKAMLETYARFNPPDYPSVSQLAALPRESAFSVRQRQLQRRSEITLILGLLFTGIVLCIVLLPAPVHRQKSTLPTEFAVGVFVARVALGRRSLREFALTRFADPDPTPPYLPEMGRMWRYGDAVSRTYAERNASEILRRLPSNSDVVWSGRRRGYVGWLAQSRDPSLVALLLPVLARVSGTDVLASIATVVEWAKSIGDDRLARLALETIREIKRRANPPLVAPD